MEKPILEARNIYKSFGSNNVLEGVSVRFYPGKAHALLGVNGAGKNQVQRSFYGALHTSRPHQRGRHPHPDRLRPSRRHCQTGRFLRSPLRGAERGRICRVAPRRWQIQRRLPAAARRQPQGGPLHRQGAGGPGFANISTLPLPWPDTTAACPTVGAPPMTRATPPCLAGARSR